MNFDWTFFWQYLLRPSSVYLNGLWLTLSISVISQGLGTLLGLFGALARMSRHSFLQVPARIFIWGMRGTPFDVFGHAKVRRTERALVDEYITLVGEASAMLATNPAKAVELVGLIDQVRGYEGVKLANVERYREALGAARQS
jgi:ABC-type amino acid transport system permease subunit